MLGTESNPGVLMHALQDLFLLKKSAEKQSRLKVWVSYLELYNESLIDLLNPKAEAASLKIKEDADVGPR
jgi:hypothetical protein